jgi:hypothetical protein
MARMSRWNGFVGASVRDSARMTGNSGTYRRLHPNFQIADHPSVIIRLAAHPITSAPALARSSHGIRTNP